MNEVAGHNGPMRWAPGQSKVYTVKHLSTKDTLVYYKFSCYVLCGEVVLFSEVQMY